MWSSDKQLLLHRETCQKCRAPGPTLDAQNKNLRETVPRRSVGTIPCEKPCFGRTYEISPVGPSCAFRGVLCCGTLCTHLSLPLDYGLREGKTSSLWSLNFQPFLSPRAWSGSVNVHLFKLNWPAGQPGTKKLDPWWNVLLHRLVVLSFLDALIFGWADAASASFF